MVPPDKDKLPGKMAVMVSGWGGGGGGDGGTGSGGGGDGGGGGEGGGDGGGGGGGGELGGGGGGDGGDGGAKMGTRLPPVQDVHVKEALIGNKLPVGKFKHRPPPPHTHTKKKYLKGLKM
jgi:hypothetical protein